MKIYLYILIFSCFVVKAKSQNYWTNFTTSNVPVFESNEFNCLTILNQQTVWAGSVNGLYFYENDQWNKFAGVTGNVSSLFADPVSGELYVGTNNGLVVIKDKSISKSYSTTSSEILSNNILSVTKDNGGKLWLGTLQGISILNGSDFINETQNLSVDADNADYPVYFSQYPPIALAPVGNKVYAGSKRGVSRLGYTEVDGISGASILDTEWSGLYSNEVSAIAINQEGHQWIGTNEAYYLHASNNTKTDWTRFALNQLMVQAIDIDKLGNIWIGTNDGLLMHQSNSNKQWFSQSNGMVGNDVNDIIVSDANEIWVATKQGISQYKGIMNSMHEKSGKKGLYIYPNPFNNELFILGDACVQFKTIDVFNIHGTLIQHIVPVNMNQRIRIEMNEELPAGLYMVRVKIGSYTITKRIIKTNFKNDN